MVGLQQAKKAHLGLRAGRQRECLMLQGGQRVLMLEPHVSATDVATFEPPLPPKSQTGPSSVIVQVDPGPDARLTQDTAAKNSRAPLSSQGLRPATARFWRVASTVPTRGCVSGVWSR